jgi:hypothetical protein
MTTTTTTINTLIKVTEGILSGDVFYGSFDTTIKGKRTSVMVSNHLKDENQKYEFRVASKCRAGFISIYDTKGTVSEIIWGYKKNSLVNIQVKNEFGQWMDVYTTKGGKWFSIDLGFLNVITVGTMRESFPDMCDMKLWEMVGAKTWADKAFSNNKKNSLK